MKTLLKLIVLVILAAAGWVAWRLQQPFGPPAGGVFVEIQRGSGTRAIAAQLAKESVIESPFLFLTVRALRPKAVLQAGEYRFDRPATVWQVFDKIARGEIYTVAVTFPEGSNLWDVARIVEEAGLGRAEEFLREARNPSLIREAVPQAESLEGYLYPATYRFTRRVTARQICRDLTARFRQAWKEAGGNGERIHEIVTLASLVEKETSVPEERPVVASVYRNRLEKDMKLECDPTTIYAAMLSGRWRGTIYQSDLQSEHPYNTYKHEGLPPGPIANPGLAALKAALAPAQTEYLFFVARADGSGGHNFSVNFKAHQAAVDSYRRNVKKGS
jgi:UPF0755 protein